MPAADRKYLAEVTEESLAGWERFCQREGIDRASLCEVMGLRLADLDRLPPVLERWVRDTRALMVERRRRG